MARFAMLMNQKLDECYNLIMNELKCRFEETDSIICFIPTQHTISCCKAEYDYVWAFTDGMITMFNHKEGFDWISMDEEWDEDTVTISIELN